MMRDKLWFVFLAAAVSSAGAIAACGDGGNSSGGAAGSGASNPDAGSSGGGGAGGAGGDGGFINFDGGEQSLVIEPQDPILDVTGVPGSLPFSAKLTDGSNPGAVDWFLDDVTVGTIGADGLFASGGFVAGKAKVTAKSGQLEASTTITVRVKIADNAGNLTPEDQGKLETGGNADPGFRWLYPYDKTVFPRGLAAPTLQLAGGADAVLVKISVGDFEYKGFFGASAPARVDLPQAVWKGVTQSAGPSDMVTVTATKLAGGAATGPVTQSWRIAQGSLSGIVYYNTYVSKLANGGAVMRIKPGSNAEVLLGGCNVCHSVSANGNVLAAGVHWTVDNPLDSATYDLTQDGTASPRYLDNDGRKFSFGGLTPDGTWMITNGIPAAGSPVRGLAGDSPSRLLDTKTGVDVAASSFTSAVKYAITPAFSPDGKRLAFSWYDVTPGRTLAMMDVDLAQSPPSFSGITELLTVPTGIVGWPSFTPDGGAVLYHAGDRFDTAGYGATPSYGEVLLVETATKAVNKLAALNGYDENGQFYLPVRRGRGGALELRAHHPARPGRRVLLGVLHEPKRLRQHDRPPAARCRMGTTSGARSRTAPRRRARARRFWVAAIDLDYQGKPDPSHPAFYLPGQELEAGNMRAFAALEPCKDLGMPCESAASCCNGNVCRPEDVDGDGTKELVCVPPPANECAQEGETCETAASCCTPGSLCINNRCANPTPK